jgi:4'-phosphopantetheinyl transferase
VTEARWPSCSPGASLDLAAGDVHVWSASLDDPPVPADALWASLSDQERRRAGRWRFERDRRRAVASRGLLRWLLASYLDVEPGAVALRSGARGKPALLVGGAGRPAAVSLADRPRLRFSVAHSEGLVLYALAGDVELGVDVERVRPVPAALAIAAAYFAPGELAALRAADAATRPRAFMLCWTRREACLKAAGVGLSRRPDGVEGDPGAGTEADRASLSRGMSTAAGWRIHRLEPAEGFVAALALSDSLPRPRGRHGAARVGGPNVRAGAELRAGH